MLNREGVFFVSGDQTAPIDPGCGDRYYGHYVAISLVIASGERASVP